jgi:type I restriction enzyme M protein
MAAILLVEQEGEEKEVYSTLDCACGSGRMLLAAARKYGKNKIYAVGMDLDIRCVMITILNLFLNGISGEVHHANALSDTIYSSRRFGRRFGLPYLEKYTPKEKDVEVLKEQHLLHKENTKMQSLFDVD